jgi:chemotaxis protein methyltransferase CheR
MPSEARPLGIADVQFVRDLVYRRAAIWLDETKDYLIESRLQQLAIDIHVQNVTELVRQARGGQPGIETKIVEAITTHETFFFRDTLPFDMLRTVLLPMLVAARQTSRSLYIWSAACSTGQEPYSIAMILADCFPEVARWPARILATDISEQILTRARTGRFGQGEVNRGLPPSYLVRFFDQVGTDWQLKPEIRKMVDFEQQNLCGPWRVPMRPDIVFLRNVLIYFDVPTKTGILRRVRETIAPDGALILGGSETTLNLDDKWERVPTGSATYYRVAR